MVKTYNRYKTKYSIIENRILFLSVRRSDISGNFRFVYDRIIKDSSLDIQLYLDTSNIQQMSFKKIRHFAHLCSTSKLIIVDEYTPQLRFIHLTEKTKVMQLWHACGAFKTFGFTRLGKPKGTPQKSGNHRCYDYVTVSGKNVATCYAEGFGIATKYVYPTGVPRTDIFFDPAYKERIRAELYERYPLLNGKKVILFAPTFRGHTKETAHYPMNRFRVNRFLDAMDQDTVLLIKHHPFIKKKHPVPKEYQDRVLDLSCESEINDLLFITDMIITDYSSLVFEASLLDIPMLFYVFDLKTYI